MLTGQLHGLVKMLDEGFRKGLALQILDVVGACPGDCQDAGRIEELRRQFPSLSEGELTQKMQELREIGRRRSSTSLAF